MNKKNIKPKEWQRCLEKLGYVLIDNNKHFKYRHPKTAKTIIVNLHRNSISVDSLREVQKDQELNWEEICKICKWN